MDIDGFRVAYVECTIVYGVRKKELGSPRIKEFPIKRFVLNPGLV